jgi:hypothetical protein
MKNEEKIGSRKQSSSKTVSCDPQYEYDFVLTYKYSQLIQNYLNTVGLPDHQVLTLRFNEIMMTNGAVKKKLLKGLM